MRRGAFITVEGGEGVGKSSSLAAVSSALRAAGVEIVLTREPGGTSLGEAVRSWILDGDHGPLSAEVEVLLMFAQRAQHINTVIQPALERGAWVVCDRFTDATLAYQGGGRGMDMGFLQSLAARVQRGLTPDLTLLLDAPVDIGLARIADRPHDHFEREDASFFERVRSTYLEQARAEPERVRVIDASQAQADVLTAIEHELDAFRQRFSRPAKARA